MNNAQVNIQAEDQNDASPEKKTLVQLGDVFNDTFNKAGEPPSGRSQSTAHPSKSGGKNTNKKGSR